MTENSVKALERRECESQEGERELKSTHDVTNFHLSRAVAITKAYGAIKCTLV